MNPPPATGPRIACGRRPAGGGPRPERGGADVRRRRRPSAAALASRRPHRRAPAQRTAAPVLAVRRPGRHGHYRIAVRRIPDGGGGSIEVHDGLPVGATVTTHGPRNAFPLTVPGYGSPTQRSGSSRAASASPRSCRCWLSPSVSASTGRWCTPAAAADSLPFIDEVSRFGDRIEIRTDDVSGLPTAADLLGDCPDGTAVYACGPAPMLTAIRSGWPAATTSSFISSGSPRHRSSTAGSSRCRRVDRPGGRRWRRRDPAGGAEAVGRRRALLVPAGFLRHLPDAGGRSGAVDHRDTLLTDPERESGMMLVCISRAANGERLTLDL